MGKYFKLNFSPHDLVLFYYLEYFALTTEEKEREVMKLTHAQQKLSSEQGARKDKSKLTIF
jgi:hypothetical protein